MRWKVGVEMFISEITRIKNYRNLSGLELSLHNEINFIVGENNLGKTNIIEMLYSLVGVGKFNDNDFYDLKEPIEIIFKISYDDDELGFFENNFDIDDKNEITIYAIQEDVDSRIDYFHNESGLVINSRRIKALNFIYYSSLRNPSKEINFTRNQGTGRVLNYIMKKSLESFNVDEMDLVKTEDIDVILENVNGTLSKIYGMSGESIEAYLSDDKEKIINKLLDIGDGFGRPLSKLGDGVQYSFNVFLNILELLVHLKTSKKDEEFDNLLIEDEWGDKYLPIILALDEIEIHQHPYRQRTIIREIKRIMSNENDGFVEILKELFGVDGLRGQIITVTHSPNILLYDYHHITRLFANEDEELDVVCGSNLKFKTDVAKHLRASFIYFKEAMFSKRVILVEGVTEFGAIPEFARRLELGLDENGIGLIKLDGATAVEKYLELFRAFGIKAIALLDKDMKALFDGIDDIYFTSETDFEVETYNLFTFKQFQKYLIVRDVHKGLIKTLKKYEPDFDAKKYLLKPRIYEVDGATGETIMNEIKEAQIKDLYSNKNVINGALVAKYVDTIPEAFEDIIRLAVEGKEDE
ncbi:MAG: AAA family ATPase [Peptostreptococcaceae bacterium]|nr:AAA family ATPase [Peptostreptococcaceae bacterium]